MSKEGVAKNALVAKYMFNNLSTDAKADMTVKALIAFNAPLSSRKDDAPSDFRRMNEAQFFTFAGYVFGNMGIKPSLKGLLYRDQWEPIACWRIALYNADKHIKSASLEIYRKHKINITLDNSLTPWPEILKIETKY